MSRGIRIICLLLLTVGVLTGCGNQTAGREIQDVNNLEGRKIGVAVAWGPDYLLSKRDDAEIVRYNSIASMILGLSCHQVDAIAVEYPYAANILACTEGTKIVDQPLASVGSCAYIRYDMPQLLEEFNTFIEDFKKTDTYQDLLERLQDEDGYEPVQVEMKGGNKTLRAGVSLEDYPYSYTNPSTGKHEGSEIEILTHFANACGYELEWIDGNYEANEMGISYGELDISAAGFSELYRGDVESTGRVLVSESYLPSDIVLLERDPAKKLKITSTIDY